MEYIEINPIDKIPELKALLSRQNIELKTSSDEGYTWLEDYSVCVVVHSPFNENTLEIELEEHTQFSLFFAGYHCHYFAYDVDYKHLCDDVLAILENRLCSATICYGENNWLGSCLLDKKAVNAPYQKNFEFVLKHPEFEEKIEKHGGIVCYRFWDGNNDVAIKL